MGSLFKAFSSFFVDCSEKLPVLRCALEQYTNFKKDGDLAFGEVDR